MRPGTIVSYPAHFRVCQREPRTDYEIYSHEPFAGVEANAGVPLTAYYGRSLGALPAGLAPVAAGLKAGLDPAWASYTHAPGGPAPEMFAAPEASETALMALAKSSGVSAAGL